MSMSSIFQETINRLKNRNGVALLSIDKEEMMKRSWHSIETHKERRNNIILGNFIAKVEKGRDGKVVGEFGLGSRNERGDRLIHFCRDNDFTIKKHLVQISTKKIINVGSSRRLWETMIRNQIEPPLSQCNSICKNLRWNRYIKRS